MLRITRIDTEQSLTLVFEGSLGGEWVAEAVRVWDTVLQSCHRGDIRIDLHGVSYVSPSGRELLAVMHQAGATLMGSGALLSNLIQEIREKEASIRSSESAHEGKQ